MPEDTGSMSGLIIAKVTEALVGRMAGDIPEEDKAGILQDYTEQMGIFNALVGQLVSTLERFAVLDEEYKCKSLVDFIRIWNLAMREEMAEIKEMAEAAEREAAGEDEGDDDPEPPDDPEDTPDGPRVLDADFKVSSK